MGLKGNLLTLTQPPQQVSRLDHLKSVMLYAVDVIITPENEVKIVELNGYSSGCEGSRELNLGIDERIADHFESYGLSQLAFLARDCSKERRACPLFHALASGRREDVGRHGYFFPLVQGLEMLLAGDAGLDIDREWGYRYGGLVERTNALRGLEEDKGTTNELFEDERIGRFKRRAYDLDDFRYGDLRLDDVIDTEFFVMKPSFGSKAKGVRVLRTEDFKEGTYSKLKALKKDGLVDSDILIEPFVLSRTVQSSKTGQDHLSCERFYMVVEEKENGNLDMFSLGGYSRLARQPFSEFMNTEDARIAKYARGFSEELSPQEDALIESALVELFPALYEVMEPRIRERLWNEREYRRMRYEAATQDI